MNELELLQRFAGDAPEPDDGWLRELRADLITPRTGRRRLKRNHAQGFSHRRLPLIAAAVLASVLVLVIVPSMLPADAPGAPDQAVADVLRRFARVAADAPVGRAPRTGEFVYEKTTDSALVLIVPGDGLQPFAYEISGIQESWVGVDGSARIVYDEGLPRFPTEADRRAFEAIQGTEAQDYWDSHRFGRTHEKTYAPGERGTGLPDLSALPTDPEELREMIYAREVMGGPPGDWESFAIAADLLGQGYMSPQLRAAMYEVMSTIPGTELIGPVHDDLGRPGVAIAYTRNGERDEIIFDRSTGKVLGTRTVRAVDDPDALAEYVGTTGGQCCASLLWSGTEAGTVMYTATYIVGSEVVGSAHERPAAPVGG